MTGLQNQHSPSPPPSKKHLERELFSTRHGEVFIRCRRALAGLTRLPTPKRLLRKNNFLALGSQISCVAFHEENPELCTIHFRTPKVIEPTLAILWRSFKTNKNREPLDVCYEILSNHPNFSALWSGSVSTTPLLINMKFIGNAWR